MHRRMIVGLALVAALGVAACDDTPTDPVETTSPEQQELVSLAYSLHLSTMAINGVQSIDVNGTRYDVGCPLQCWLPIGIVNLIAQQNAAGALSIMHTSPPHVYVASTKTPVYLQNGRPVPECSNGKDDDGDELVDYPYDPGCTSPEDNDETDPPPPPPPTVKFPPTITAPSLVIGKIPSKGLKVWNLKCPIQGTLHTADARTWTALGVEVTFEYVKFVWGQGWVVNSTETISQLDDATAGGQVLGSGWMYTLPISNHEARMIIKVRVRGSDGEELLIPVNGGSKIFCAL